MSSTDSLHTRLRIAILVLLATTCRMVIAEEIPFANGDIAPPPNAEWRGAIHKAAPATPTVSAAKRKVLVFSLFTGFDHKVIPYVNEVLQILGKKSKAFDVDVTVDIEALSANHLAAYDVLVLNNNCSIGPRRNLVLDELERNPKYRDLAAQQRQARAALLEQSVLDFVSKGKGLIVLHGALTMFNNSAKFTEMVGAAFDFHPPAQRLTICPLNADDPLTAAFKDKGPFIHVDEPYYFNGYYQKKNFRPLLVLDTKKMYDPKGDARRMIRYVAWVKPYGCGRVFYCSLSHYPRSYESRTLLQFLLDGLQYVAGDLHSDNARLGN